MFAPLRDNTAKAPVYKSTSMTAPVKGWNAKDSLADMEEDYAVELENMFPDLTDVSLRSGHASWSTGVGAAAVETLAEYAGVSSNKLISAGGTSIYDSSAEAAATEIATGKANARWQTTMFNTAGGNFLYMVNGADAPIYYDGSTFTTPSLTGVTATDIVHVLAHQTRLFFVFNDSMSFGYLAVGAVAGAVSTFNIGTLCPKGGYIVALGSWTRDGGSGPDDIFVAVTSEGEVVIYSGIDPATAADWSLVGVFSIGKPIGRRCMEKVGADLIVITQAGAIPLSLFLPIDRVGERGKTLSANIVNDFLKATRSYGALFGWQSLHYPQGSYALFNIPKSGVAADQYIVNTQTGAWCKFTNQNAACWSLFNGNLYFGGQAGGIVSKADNGTDDSGTNIPWKIRPAFSYYGSRGLSKLFTSIRPHFKSNGSPSIAIDLNVDFSNLNPTSIPTQAPLDSGLWDVGLWDVMLWGSDGENFANWTTIYGYGDSASPTIRGGDQGITLSFSAYDMIWQQGSAL